MLHIRATSTSAMVVGAVKDAGMVDEVERELAHETAEKR